MISETIKPSFRKHYLLVLYVPLYIGLFFLVEKLVPTTGYWVSYCKIDDFIPFCEYFIVPYFIWYFYLVFIGVWLMLKDEKQFKLYMYSIIIGFTFSLVFCLIFPNGQDLRPVYFQRDNFFVDMVKVLYSTDTNTNVFPSIHVYGAIVGAVGVLTTKTINNKWTRGIVIILGFLIALSTCFIKQHSVLDCFASVVLYVIIYAIVYIFINKRI